MNDTLRIGRTFLPIVVVSLALLGLGGSFALLRAALRQEPGVFFFALTLVVPMLIALGLFGARALRTASYQPLLQGGRGFLAGALGGLVLGAGLRLGMRLVALAAGKPLEFSVGGTLFILLFSTIVGALYALFFTALRGWLPGRRSRRALVLGGLLFLLFLYPFYPAAAGDLQESVSPALLVLLTCLLSGLWIPYGFTVELILERLEHY